MRKRMQKQARAQLGEMVKKNLLLDAAALSYKRIDSHANAGFRDAASLLVAGYVLVPCGGQQGCRHIAEENA